jgi:hypothetical protein
VTAHNLLPAIVTTVTVGGPTLVDVELAAQDPTGPSPAARLAGDNG